MSDKRLRAEYDAVQKQAVNRDENPFQTYDGQAHPYTNQPKRYGINEEVWYAHHYGGSAYRNNDVPGRVYGTHIIHEMYEAEVQDIAA